MNHSPAKCKICGEYHCLAGCVPVNQCERRGDMLGLEKCGCFVVHVELDEMEIQYCPKHEAVDDLYEGLKDALKEICRMCVRLNPQHEDCTSCEEMERSRLPLLKAEGRNA